MTRLDRLGIAYDDACQLRRISLTLRRWFERECNGEIQRDETSNIPYAFYGQGTKGPFLTVKAADKETGARLRLADILTRYPDLVPYIQTDPRGCAVYLLTKEQAGSDDLSRIYNRGTAIY